MRVMIVVTHLLGTGHLSRALTLGRAFSAVGHDATVVSGGGPALHLDTRSVRMVQLPPVASDGVDFSRLLDEKGAEVSQHMMDARKDLLRATLADGRPDVLITELFPFGRRILSDEFETLLDAAQNMVPKPIVLSSVRDILAPPSKPQKAARTEAIIRRFYDAVLVHADASVIALDQSWPVTPAIEQKLRYTGFVAPPAPQPGRKSSETVVVSAGGGAVGTAIFEAACAAAKQMPQFIFRLFVGGEETRRADLGRNAPENVTISPPTTAFRSLLTRATASISMCGYNTALDLLQTGVPAVIVPFDDGGEVEQSLRAKALSRLPAMTVVRQTDLTGDRLASAVAHVIADAPREPQHGAMDGAAQTVRIAEELWKARG